MPFELQDLARRQIGNRAWLFGELSHRTVLSCFELEKTCQFVLISQHQSPIIPTT